MKQRDTGRFVTREARDLPELIALTTPSSKDAISGRFRSIAIYRGLSDASYPLVTSLDRLGGDAPLHSKVHLEMDLLRHFRRRIRAFDSRENIPHWELIVLAQHHQLPTRLMDWTFSPLVAAHFATIGGKPGVDRIVWKLDWREMHQAFGVAGNAILIQDAESDWSVHKDSPKPSFWELIQQAEANQRDHFAFMLEPPALHPRVTAQSGVFTVSSDKTRSLTDMLGSAGLRRVLTRIIIPADCVDRFRDQLDIAAVNEGTIFPGIDGIAADIRRWYEVSPRLR